MPRTIKQLAQEPALPEGERVLSASLRLDVPRPCASVRLQVSGRTAPAASTIAIRDVLLPREPNTWAGTDPVICRIAPDAWLLQSRRDSGAELAGTVRSASGSLSFALTDLSDALVTLELEGPDSYFVLARGCGLDLSPAAFGARACAATRLAQCAVLIRHAAPARLEIVADRPVARYLYDWLLDAAGGVG